MNSNETLSPEMETDIQKDNLRNLADLTRQELENIATASKNPIEDDVENKEIHTSSIKKMREFLRGPQSTKETDQDKEIIERDPKQIDILTGVDDNLKQSIYDSLQQIPTMIPKDADQEKMIPEILDQIINDLKELADDPSLFKVKNPDKLNQLQMFFSNICENTKY